MKFVFMHANSIKIVEEIIKIIHDMNTSVFGYKLKIDDSFQQFKLAAMETATSNSKLSPTIAHKKTEKSQNS